MRRLSLVLAPLVLASCSLLVDLTGLTSDGSAPDGSGGDGGTDAASGNILVNAGFENSVGGCSPGWTTNNATMNTVDAAHSGSFACEVCITTAGKVAYLEAPYVSTAVGTRYFVEAYLMGVPDAALSQAGIYTEEAIPNGIKAAGSAYADLTSPAWQQVNTTTSPYDDAGTGGIRYTITLVPLDGGSRGCILVDDTQMVPLPP